MPEATMDEDRDPTAHEGDVRATEDASIGSTDGPLQPISGVTGITELTAHETLWLGVAPPIGSHHPPRSR